MRERRQDWAERVEVQDAERRYSVVSKMRLGFATQLQTIYKKVAITRLGYGQSSVASSQEPGEALGACAAKNLRVFVRGGNLPRGRGMNETRHDPYVLDASKQTNSLVTASATHVASACLLARSQTTTRHTTPPKIKTPFSHWHHSLENVTWNHPYIAHIHTSRQDQSAPSDTAAALSE